MDCARCLGALLGRRSSHPYHPSRCVRRLATRIAASKLRQTARRRAAMVESRAVPPRRRFSRRTGIRGDHTSAADPRRAGSFLSCVRRLRGPRPAGDPGHRRQAVRRRPDSKELLADAGRGGTLGASVSSRAQVRSGQPSRSAFQTARCRRSRVHRFWRSEQIRAHPVPAAGTGHRCRSRGRSVSAGAALSRPDGEPALLGCGDVVRNPHRPGLQVGPGPARAQPDVRLPRRIRVSGRRHQLAVLRPRSSVPERHFRWRYAASTSRDRATGAARLSPVALQAGLLRALVDVASGPGEKAAGRAAASATACGPGRPAAGSDRRLD